MRENAVEVSSIWFDGLDMDLKKINGYHDTNLKIVERLMNG